MSALGGIAYLGFRVWEIIDVWTGATPVDTSLKRAAWVIPDNEPANKLVDAEILNPPPLLLNLSLNF